MTIVVFQKLTTNSHDAAYQKITFTD